VAGAATVAAGLFRRDHLLLTGPGFTGESWHNQVHDVVSGIAYAAMIAAPLVLAHSFRADPDWAGLRRPLQALALASAAALALFASGAVQPHDAVVQRAAVSLPLAAEVLIAARLLAAGRRARPGRRPGVQPAGAAEPGQPGRPGRAAGRVTHSPGARLGYAAPGGDLYRGRPRPGGP
jgi:hypothetical protein